MENKRLAYKGGDPLAEKRKVRDVLTFSQAVERCLESKLAEFRSDKHRKQWRSTLDTYAAPVLGGLPVDAIEVRDVLRVLQPLWADKTETASRLRGRIEGVLSWATVAGIARATTRRGGAATFPSCWRNRARWPREAITRRWRWRTCRAGGASWQSGRAWRPRRCNSRR